MLLILNIYSKHNNIQICHKEKTNQLDIENQHTLINLNYVENKTYSFVFTLLSSIIYYNLLLFYEKL